MRNIVLNNIYEETYKEINNSSSKLNQDVPSSFPKLFAGKQWHWLCLHFKIRMQFALSSKFRKLQEGFEQLFQKVVPLHTRLYKSFATTSTIFVLNLKKEKPLILVEETKVHLVQYVHEVSDPYLSGKSTR